MVVAVVGWGVGGGIVTQSPNEIIKNRLGGSLFSKNKKKMEEERGAGPNGEAST